MERYRTRVVRVQAIRVTRDMYDGTEPLPEGVSIGMSMPGDYLVKWKPGCPWVAMAKQMFEYEYEPDQPAELLRIAK